MLKISSSSSLLEIPPKFSIAFLFPSQFLCFQGTILDEALLIPSFPFHLPLIFPCFLLTVATLARTHPQVPTSLAEDTPLCIGQLPGGPKSRRSAGDAAFTHCFSIQPLLLPMKGLQSLSESGLGSWDFGWILAERGLMYICRGEIR